MDPHGKESGVRPPRLRGDLLLSSWGEMPGTPEDEGGFVITGPGEYERKGISVKGILTFRDDEQGSVRGLNTAYVIRAEEVSVCHVGGLGQKELTPEQLQAIGNVDVLVLPVGGHGVLSPKEATRVIAQIEPKMVIPVQFAVSGSPYPAESVDTFIKEVGLEAEKTDKLKVAKKTLPVDETKLMVLGA